MSRLSFFALVFLIASCTRLPHDITFLSPSSQARLLLYIHSTSLVPTDIDFTISGIELEASDGKWVKLADAPINISAISLLSGQMFLKETFPEAGFYKGIKLKISKASIKGRDGRASLAMPQPDGEVIVKTSFRLQKRESFVVSFSWNPEKSVEKGYLFHPTIVAEPQVLSARGLLVFISNSGSNYISIIDRSLERVIGAVTVGDRPMGMALNNVQDRLYVLNPGSRSISVIDPTQFSVLDTIHLTAGIGSTDMVFVPDVNDFREGKLYIINRVSNDITIVSTATRRVLKSLSAGMSSPAAISVNVVRKEIYVTDEGLNNLTIISAVNDSLITNIAVGNRPTGIVVGKDLNGDDKIYVFNEGSNNISVISPSLRKVTATIPLVDPPKRGLQGFNNRLFVVSTSANKIMFLNSLDVVIRTIPVNGVPVWLAGDEKYNRLYITNYGDNSVSFFDPIGEIVIKKLSVGKNPYGVILIEK